MNLLSIFTALTLAANTGFNFALNLDGFLQTLPMMLYGMLGIFIVILAIIIAIYVCFRLTIGMFSCTIAIYKKSL